MARYRRDKPRTWDYEITLIKTIKTKDEDGFDVDKTVKRDVLANRLPVFSSEFYQSKKEGFTTDEVFEINEIEYEDEDKVLFEGKTFRVNRRFNDGDYVELYCSDLGET